MLQLFPSDNTMTDLLNRIKDSGEEVILFGASKCGMDYYNVLKEHGIGVKCFADDNPQKQEATLYNIPVLSTEKAFSREGAIILASYGPEKLLARLRQIHPELEKRAVQVDFYLYDKGFDYYRYYMEHMQQLDEVYSLLVDEQSRTAFKNLLEYKITRNRRLIDEIREDVSLQYFDPSIYSMGEKEIFVDAGAYAGDTVETFLKYAKGSFERIIALEPDEDNFRKLEEKYGSLDKVDCYPVGVAAADGELYFNASGDWTSSVDTKGNTTIQVRSIDSILAGSPATFLKADIEGMEMEMLLGAESTIRQYKPKIAIAVYHKKDDIFEIPLLIHQYNPNYKFYLRHYTEMPIDSVLYAVP